MTFSFSYQWPITISVALHLCVFGVVIAVLNVLQTIDKPSQIAAATTINVTMIATKAILETAKPIQEEIAKPEQVKKEKTEPVTENKPTITTSENSSPVLAMNTTLDIPSPTKEKETLKQPQAQTTERTVVEEKAPKEQEFQPEQAFSKEALVIQDQVIGQQLKQQTA